MSQFIPYVPFEPRGATWRPLSVNASADRPWSSGMSSGGSPGSPRPRAPVQVAAPEPIVEPLVDPSAESEHLLELRAAEHAEAMELVEQEREVMKAELLRLSAATLAMEAATREMEVATLTLEAGARALEAAHVTLVGELRTEAGEVIREAARRIAGDALHVDPQLLGALVEEAVAALGRDGLQVHVSPLDADTLRERMPGLDVVEDFTIEAGCLCVGPAGRIDASLESAMVAVGAAIERWAVGG
ncbi:MAG: FliH/SctL family protein [Pseudomonadota bacterium]|nr:FliH/SctL family protein [Pseudomonadota bacterium]